MQQKLEVLENPCVITRGVSPWASPIVIVPKCTVPGKPPRRRLCVDFRVVNKLLPPLQRYISKAKVFLTLGPLAKID